MYVLGIETSCDETSAAIVKDGKRILSNVVASSLRFHRKYGGIVPEIASRMQIETITQVVDKAIREAKIKLKDLGLICVTDSPGLLGSLLVGIGFAKSLSLSLDIPLLGVNHLHSHIYAGILDKESLVSLPFVSLVVSGGHTSLFYVKDFNKIKTLGQTLDDACGEAFDKVAKILGLGYPGGPLIEKLAKKNNNSKTIRFKCSETKSLLDFSFSGIKTAVLYYVRSRELEIRKKEFQASNLKLQTIIASSFQEAVIEVLIRKSVLACRLYKINQLVIGGGVAANNRLRERFYEDAKREGLNVVFPTKKLCMDNAAMVAGLGYQLFKKGKSSNLYLTANLN